MSAPPGTAAGDRPPAPEGALPYVGRFAPSPTGLLHAGSLVAALASWLDARAHGGRWLVRIEDVDTPRCQPGADDGILQQLATCGLTSDEPVCWQSQRDAEYQAALDGLKTEQAAYPCGCSRKDIATAQAAAHLEARRHHILPYPGTCRPDHGGLRGKPARAWRFDTRWGLPPDAPAPLTTWRDRRLGAQHQCVSDEVGDFVLRRADALWAYQLAVVVDDAAQGVTHVVRGEDLADNTARQILLQRALSLPTPRYLHTPLVRGDNGEKLSKQNGARALDLRDPTAALHAAGQHLGLHIAPTGKPADWLQQAVPAWRDQLQAWATGQQTAF
ncbi:tRNA glutamyl-Q(34) synthetase GluQRS [Comamonas serinivorans]|uniref:Glutamyl-Q tRNA(Asp) synthetase n=1 Tax=Comamonas serinivorans TaxID=1082851 RepID=A0A1Y0EPN8_9BURK|nr:tRNA glutamyl-Q(34) synthetase GluQRS [Comamonas serinivorans]ARU05371.1 tRNA glutamyl-Q(34) synthetase GluQRS [Comamonas serinivorans]